MRSGAMADLAARLEVRGRRIVVVAGPGDRRDEDIRAIAHQGRRTLRSLHLPPRRQSARPRRARNARRCSRESLRERGRPGERHRGDSRRAGRHRRRAAHGPAGRSAAGVRRCAHPILEADHQIQADRRRIDATARTATLRPPPAPQDAAARARTERGRHAGTWTTMRRSRRKDSCARSGVFDSSAKRPIEARAMAERELQAEPAPRAGAELRLRRLAAADRPEPLLRRAGGDAHPARRGGRRPAGARGLGRAKCGARRRALGWPDPAAA